MADSNNPAANSIFMKIIRREIPSEILHEDDKAIAIRDINAKAPVHFLVIPKEPLVGLSHATDSHEQLLGHLLNVARKVAVQEHLENGYRVGICYVPLGRKSLEITHRQTHHKDKVLNDGKNGGQEVQHLHIHVLGGRQMNWPPG